MFVKYIHEEKIEEGLNKSEIKFNTDFNGILEELEKHEGFDIIKNDEFGYVKGSYYSDGVLESGVDLNGNNMLNVNAVKTFLITNTQLHTIKVEGEDKKMLILNTLSLVPGVVDGKLKIIGYNINHVAFDTHLRVWGYNYGKWTQDSFGNMIMLILERKNTFFGSSYNISSYQTFRLVCDTNDGKKGELVSEAVIEATIHTVKKNGDRLRMEQSSIIDTVVTGGRGGYGLTNIINDFGIVLDEYGRINRSIEFSRRSTKEIISTLRNLPAPKRPSVKEKAMECFIYRYDLKELLVDKWVPKPGDLGGFIINLVDSDEKDPVYLVRNYQRDHETEKATHYKLTAFAIMKKGEVLDAYLSHDNKFTVQTPKESAVFYQGSVVYEDFDYKTAPLLRYIADVIGQNSSAPSNIQVIENFMKEPETEVLFKSTLKEVITFYNNGLATDARDIVKSKFGKLGDKGGINEIVGLTQKQIELIFEYKYAKTFAYPLYAKILLKPEQFEVEQWYGHRIHEHSFFESKVSITEVDLDTLSNIISKIDEITKTLLLYGAGNYTPNVLMSAFYYIALISKSNSDLLRSLDFLNKLISKDITFSGYETDRLNPILDHYLDYLHLLVESKNSDIEEVAKIARNYRAYATDGDLIDDRISVMNNVLTVYRSEMEREAWNKLKDNKKIYEYEDDNFKIIVPEEITDIAFEGASLRHCVASYIPRVLNKSTLILFLRKKNDLDQSYYTVEVKNDKIVQVRGLQNAKPTYEVSRFISKYRNDVLNKIKGA